MDRLCMLASLIGLLLMQPAWARDVATEQYNASVARKHFLETRSEYEAIVERAEQQAARVAQEQARLDELRKQQKAAKARMDEAKAKLKQRELALEKAWNN